MRLTVFASGSSGNCALLSVNGLQLLLDAGISYRKICRNLSLSGLLPEQLSAILITHEHADHVSGLATLVKHCTVPIYAPRTVANALCRTVAGVEPCLRVLPAGGQTELSGVRIRSFPTPHDTAESVGWRIEGEKIFALATDMGRVTQEIRGGLLGADLVLIEANHDVDRLLSGPYPYSLKQRILSDHGHLSNDACAELAAELAGTGTRQIILGHLSRENNTPELAFRTVHRALEGSGAALYVASAEERLTLELTEEGRLCCP